MTSQGDVSAATRVTSTMTEEDLLRQRQKMERIALRIQAYFVRFLFVFQGITQQYVTMYYLLDFAFMNCSSLTRTALRLWAWHLCLVGTVNWLCLLYYRDEYDPAKHRPNTPAPASNTEPPTHSSQDDDRNNSNNNPDATDSARTDGNPIDNNTQTDDTAQTNEDSAHKSGEGRPLQWTYCARCQMDTPPRTRHCKKCEVCVVRRDHHCELVGCCVGHRNQRYFVVLANYGVFVTYIGAYMTLTYLYHHHPEGSSLWNYFLPVAFFEGLRGNISGLQVLLTYHAYMLVAFCPLTIVYFLSEMSVILQGKTMHEVMKKMKHIRVSSSVPDRLRVVFGDHWWLNFIFPTRFFIPHPHNGMDFTGVTVMDGDAPSETEHRPVDKKQD